MLVLLLTSFDAVETSAVMEITWIRQLLDAPVLVDMHYEGCVNDVGTLNQPRKCNHIHHHHRGI